MTEVAPFILTALGAFLAVAALLSSRLNWGARLACCVFATLVFASVFLV